MPEPIETTMKQAAYAVLGLFIFAALIGLIPATEAYSSNWLEYWGGVAAVAGIIAIGFYIGRQLKR
jgi:hypothetical protein